MRTAAKEFFSDSLTIDLRSELNAIRARSLVQRQFPDLLWRRLCAVIATSGSSVNSDAFLSRYDTNLRFDLLPKTHAARKRAIFKQLQETRVPRLRDKKAQNLSENYEKVKSLGGPEMATKIMLSLNGKTKKKKWIRQFSGVGEKYSNDIWMDIYDSDFHDAIALDARVKNFAKKLGFDPNSRNLANDLLQFASECGLSGWELDRLIYNFGDVILKVIQPARP